MAASLSPLARGYALPLGMPERRLQRGRGPNRGAKPGPNPPQKIVKCALRQASYRLRQRHGQVLRVEIAHTGTPRCPREVFGVAWRSYSPNLGLCGFQLTFWLDLGEANNRWSSIQWFNHLTFSFSKLSA